MPCIGQAPAEIIGIIPGQVAVPRKHKTDQEDQRR